MCLAFTIKTFVKSSNRCGAFLLKLYVLKATPVPAQFTFTSKRPNLFFVSLMALVTSASLVTSTGTNRTFSPSSLATSCPRDVDKSASTTLAPFCANLSTVARPRPDAPPVMSATVFYGCNENILSISSANWRATYEYKARAKASVAHCTGAVLHFNCVD